MNVRRREVHKIVTAHTAAESAATWGFRDSLLKTAQEAVTVLYKDLNQ